MIKPIQLPYLEFFNENFNLGESQNLEYLTEATFTGGKANADKLLPLIKVCKDILDAEIKDVDDSAAANRKDKSIKVKRFDTIAYWKNSAWRDLEDKVSEVFGFRDCEIAPWQERYGAKSKEFETCELNAYVSRADRFPIEGLITENGYYDKTHSSRMYIALSLGLIKKLEADELLAVILHEFGHSIDPALTTITYTGTDELVKYITDRKGKKNDSEKQSLSDAGVLILVTIFCFIPFIISTMKNVIDWFQRLIMGKKWFEEKQLKKVMEALKKDKGAFERQTYSEAFADNFARMYGYATPLAKGLQKLDKNFDEKLNKWVEKDHKRQEIIVGITISALKDEHKTDIHRVMNLIKEYENDLKDPNIPDDIKKAMNDDLDGLKEVLDSYMNDFGEFQNKVNKVIKESIENQTK